jgi:hypothetical protein
MAMSALATPLPRLNVATSKARQQSSCASLVALITSPRATVCRHAQSLHRFDLNGRLSCDDDQDAHGPLANTRRPA